jgi:hypothetical protein
MALRHWMIGARCFKTAYWSHLQGSNEMSPLCCPEILDANHPVTWRHTPREQAPHLYPCESLKPCKFTESAAKVRQPEIWYHSMTLTVSSDFDADCGTDLSDLSECDHLS